MAPKSKKRPSDTDISFHRNSSTGGRERTTHYENNNRALRVHKAVECELPAAGAQPPSLIQENASSTLAVLSREIVHDDEADIFDSRTLEFESLGIQTVDLPPAGGRKKGRTQAVSLIFFIKSMNLLCNHRIIHSKYGCLSSIPILMNYSDSKVGVTYLTSQPAFVGYLLTGSLLLDTDVKTAMIYVYFALPVLS